MVVNEGNAESADEYRWDVPDGSGCAEVWEAMVEARQDDETEE